MITPIIILLINGLCWGFSFSLARITAENFIHPFGVAFWQSFIAAIILIIFIFFSKNLKYLKISINLIKLYLFLSVVGIVVPSVLIYFAAAKVPSGILAILITLAPIMTYSMALIFRLESYSSKRIFGVFFGFLSVFFLVFPEQSLPNPAMIPWIIIGCFCASCYAFQGLIISVKFNKENNPLIMAFWMNVVSFIILIPSLFFENTKVFLGFNLALVDISLVLLGIIEALCFSLQMYLITRAGAVFASQVGYIVTISGVLWGIFIFGESHSLFVFISFLLVLLGLIMVKPINN